MSESSQNWALYLCGVKQIIRGSLMQREIYDGEFAVLRDWVYSHEVLAHFSLVHYESDHRSKDIICTTPLSKSVSVSSDRLSKADSTVEDSVEVLELISSIFHFVPISSPQSHLTFEHRRQISQIEHRLSRLIFSAPEEEGRQKSNLNGNGTAPVTRLCHLAGLIYLNRAVLRYSGIEPQHRRLVNRAFSALVKMSAREVEPWPLFIVACEAQTDPERRWVLERFSEAQKQRQADNIALIRRMSVTFWNQDDLDTEEEIEYATKITAAVSAAPFLPTFA
ncbi:MAG: hypothetical protein Q9227_005315 [Pyrenula ochraceoflavens]